ncbi:MAG: 9-O-acetylesterase, partial [Flavitalea sp.]
IIDIGDSNDIHPKNKIDVGKRLAKAALQSTYKMEGEWSSPMFDRAEIMNDKALIHFKNFQGSLVTNDKYGFVKGFMIAGSDSVFHWAKASIDNNIVTVSSVEVKKPVAIRYAWANNPGELNLYNKDGLPVAPFRTDSWPSITKGNKFSENPK